MLSYCMGDDAWIYLDATNDSSRLGNWAGCNPVSKLSKLFIKLQSEVIDNIIDFNLALRRYVKIQNPLLFAISFLLSLLLWGWVKMNSEMTPLR